MPPIPHTNGTKPATKTEKPVPTQTQAIDLSVDLATLKVSSGEPSLLSLLFALDMQLAALETVEAKRVATARAIGGRLHTNGISKIRIVDGKIVDLNATGGEVWRVRGVNGSPGVYQLYPETERKPRQDKPPVDLATL